MAEKRIDIISDTHGCLAPALRQELVGADLIIHAGDITSLSDLRTLQAIAPVQAVLGNNDFSGAYGPHVKRHNHFVIDGVSFDLAHFEQDVCSSAADVCVFGHTHRPKIKEVQGTKSKNRPVLFINPGSPTYPRGEYGPTMARLWIRDEHVEDPEIVELQTGIF